MTAPLRCWPGCLAEIITAPNAGRRCVVEREVAPEEHPFPWLGAAWFVTMLQPMRVAIGAGGHQVGELVLPGCVHEVVCFDCDLRPIPPPPEAEPTAAEDTAPSEVEPFAFG